MAYENGYNMFDYCEKTFNKYKDDRLLFYKALQVFNSFENRKDYPFCTNELSEICERLFGYDLNWVTDFLWRYTITNLSEKMIWDARNALPTDENPERNLIVDFTEEEGNALVSSFQNDMKIFFITMHPLFEDLFSGDASSLGIDKIAQKQTYGEEKNVRFIRKDGRTFDFVATKKDIEKIIDAFSNMV